MYFYDGAAGKKVRHKVRIVFIFLRQNTHFKSADMYIIVHNFNYNMGTYYSKNSAAGFFRSMKNKLQNLKLKMSQF